MRQQGRVVVLSEPSLVFLRQVEQYLRAKGIHDYEVYTLPGGALSLMHNSDWLKGFKEFLNWFQNVSLIYLTSSVNSEVIAMNSNILGHARLPRAQAGHHQSRQSHSGAHGADAEVQEPHSQAPLGTRQRSHPRFEGLRPEGLLIIFIIIMMDIQLLEDEEQMIRSKFSGEYISQPDNQDIDDWGELNASFYENHNGKNKVERVFQMLRLYMKLLMSYKLDDYEQEIFLKFSSDGCNYNEAIQIKSFQDFYLNERDYYLGDLVLQFPNPDYSDSNTYEPVGLLKCFEVFTQGIGLKFNLQF